MMSEETDTINRTKSLWKKKKFYVPGVLIVVFVLIVLYSQKSDSGEQRGDTATVDFGGVIDRLTETGTIELVRSVEVKSKISGKIKQLLVEEGDAVETNQVLAIVEPDPNQALMLYGKRAAVDRARIEYLEKERELERQKSLLTKNLVSRQEVERLENMYHLALNSYKQALLEQRILEMEMAEASSGSIENLDPQAMPQLDDYRIIAPIPGIVIARNVEVGEMVVTGISSYMVGTTAFQIGDPSEMVVKSSISEVDIGKLRLDQDVKIRVDSYPDELFQGAVKQIAPVGTINPGAMIVTFEVEIEILNADARLRQGMSCDIDIIFAKRDSVLVLPVEAVHEVMKKDEEGEETAQVDSVVAFRWREDRFEEIRIVPGLESSNRIEIVSGLEQGDEVSLEAMKKYKLLHKESIAAEEKQNEKQYWR